MIYEATMSPSVTVYFDATRTPNHGVWNVVLSGGQ